MKKTVVFLLIIIVAAFSFFPLAASFMASSAFETDDSAQRDKYLFRAIKIYRDMYMFKYARNVAEKAIIYFPESKDMDYYLFSAAESAEKEGNRDAAIHWYMLFIEMYPRHQWSKKAMRTVNRLFKEN